MYSPFQAAVVVRVAWGHQRQPPRRATPRRRLRHRKTEHRRERPNWGLAQLMRPTRAAPDVLFVLKPLCWRPNACDSNHCGTLTRWDHVNLRPDCERIILRLGPV